MSPPESVPQVPLSPVPPSPMQPTPMPPQTADLQLIAGLHADLVEADFTNDAVAELLGQEAVAALGREQVVAGQLRTLEALCAAQGAAQNPTQDAAQNPTQGAAQDSIPGSAEDQPHPQPHPQHHPHWRVAVLSALWLVSVEVTADQVNAALPRTGVQGLQQLNLAEVLTAGGPASGTSVVAPCADLRPYQVQGEHRLSDLWVTSDLSAHQVAGALPHDHVLGVGQASLTLAASTHRRPAAKALDLGTGCGIQLLHLLDHCDHVTGTDLSARALEFARFNLLLNAEALGLDPQRLDQRVHLLQGSLLEPVSGQNFDLVVSNPPFVITPRTEQEDEADRYIYRDGGREGDTLMAELIAGLPGVLNPGGTAQMLGNWEVGAPQDTGAGHTSSPEHDGGPRFDSDPDLASDPDPDDGPEHEESSTEPAAGPNWTARPRLWVQETGLHAWFIQRDVQTPAEYAETWLRDASEERSISDYRHRYAEYLADFEARGVEQIGFGLIWVQQPAGPQQLWRRFEEVTGAVQQPLGPHIGETAARAAQGQDAVVNQLLVVPDSVTEERYQRFGAEHPEVIIARQGGGLRRARPISSAAAGFLAAADGDFTAAQLISAVCSLIDADEEALAQEVLDLYLEGFLVAQ